jgi:hypothetical protein
MELNFNKRTAGAFSSAVERETILTNRVSPKNDRSRINFLNKFVLSIFVILCVNNVFSQRLNMNTSIENSTFSFLENIPEKMLVYHGINNRDEINRAVIGSPIAMYIILNDSLTFTNTWRVPFIIDNEYKALLTVFENEEKGYEIVDFGASLLAKEIFMYIQKNGNELKGLLRIYNINQDFYIRVKNTEEYEFQPVINPESATYTLEEILILNNN